MNRHYKVVWSRVKHMYVVVSELAKNNGKAASTKSSVGQKLGVALSVLALCAGMTAGVSAADQYYSANDMGGRLANMGNQDNSGAQGIGSVAAGVGAKVNSASGSFQGAMATVVGSLNTVAAGTQTVVPFDGVANAIVGAANATQNANATLIFGAGNAVTNSYGDVTFNIGNVDPTDPIATAKALAASVGNSGGQVLVVGGANTVDYARFSAITGVSNSLTGNSSNGSEYNFITGAKNTLSNTDSTYVIGSSNTVSDGTSNVVIGDKRKLTGATNDVVIGSADEEMETTVSDATILGHNANATVADGVALGSNSVASVAAGVAGTVPTGTTVSDTDKASATWTSTLGAVSVGDTANNLTRQITGVAAGTQATDAVNVAQLNAVNTVVNTNTTSLSALQTTVAANAPHFIQINTGTSGTNYNNNGAPGTDSIAIGRANTAANRSIIIGQGTISNNDASKAKGNGDVAIGVAVQVNNYVNQGGGIAIGYNARSENMNGRQEYYLGLGQTKYSGGGFFSIGTPDNPENMVTGIAIGRNSFARSGSTMVGTHNYSGAIGDVTLSTNPASSMLQPNLSPFATTIGANSFSAGAMSTVTGVYSIATSDYKGLGGFNFDDTAKAPKNFGATIMGSLNSIESATSENNAAGVATSIVGLANVANNANGALIFGAGNEISNSITDIDVPQDSTISSAKALQTKLMSAIKSSNSGGSTMVMGGGNKADYTQLSSVIGVNNTLSGTSDDISTYNYISGFNNTASNVDNVTVIGRNRNVTGADNSIVIGRADSTLETTASDAVAIGRNTNVTIDGGTALGLNSIASVDKGSIGYDQSGKITDTTNLAGNNQAQYDALQATITTNKQTVSDLNATITQLEEEQSQYNWWDNEYFTIASQIKENQEKLATAEAELTSNEIAADKMIAAWQATGASVSVGDSSTGLSRQITNVAAGTNDTDAVNVAQLKAAKVEVVGSGDNVTVTSDNSEGYTKYTVAATDTQVTGLSLDKNTLTLTQNGLEPLTVEGIATTADLAADKTHFFSVNSGTSGTNYNNDGAKGTDSIAIGKASTAADNSIAIGNGASVSDSNGGKGSGDIAIGNGAKINNYVDQSASIAIGQNAQIDNMSGMQEFMFGLGQTNYNIVDRPGGGMAFIPEDPSKVATGIAIGENTFVRTGGLMIGTHNYRGALGDVDVDSANIRATGVNVNSTTLGTNSYNSGAFATIVGSYSIASGNYASGGDENNAGKNLGTTIVGSLNSVESSTAENTTSGVANSVVGFANRTFNSNGSLIFGAGNEITNSVSEIEGVNLTLDGSAKDLQTGLIEGIKASNSGGSTLAIGGANKADYTLESALIGVNNTLKGTDSAVSQYNLLTGYNNTATSVENVTVTGSNNTVSGSTSIVNLGNENAVADLNNTILLGDNRTVTGSDNSVILGRANSTTTNSTFRAAADTTLTTTADNVVVMGYNANATVDDSVALGSNSVASVDKGVAGYNPSTKELTGTAWTSTVGSVSVGDAANEITRQITGVAAGTADTDAVNVAQLKANKVDLKAGDKVTITSAVADDGATTYTIASTDTNTVLAKGEITYSTNGADGTLVLTDSDNNPVEVTGLKNTFVESAALDTDTHTLTLTRNEGAPIQVTGIATTADITANKVKYFSVKSELAANQNNDGAKGTNSVAIGPNAVAEHENGIALGTNVLSGGKGSVVIGSDARVAQNIALEGSIVIGKGAEAFTGGGEQEALLGMDPTNWPKRGSGGYDNPTDASRVATSIVIGTNAYGRTGTIDIGDRVYKGTMGGKEITDKNSSFHVNQTTLGTNSYNKGLFSTMVGSYSIATGGFTGDGGRNTLAYGAQNFGATVMGSLNSIRSNGSGSLFNPSYQGVANTIVGLGNITDNTNGSLVFGAGNKITNSITDISMPTSGADSVDAMVDKLQDTIKKSSSGGATLAIGGGNTADYTRRSSIIGVNNTLTGASSNISQNNALTGYNNKATNVDNVTVTGTNNTVTDTTTAVVIGDNRTLTGVNNNVILGSADSALETTVSDAVAVGRNANVTIEGGVALGANSVARTDKGVVGYDPSGRITDADSILGSNTQYQSLQTEVTDAQTTITTLNSEAAELQGYMDQIKQIDPNGYEQQEAYQAFKAQYDAKQTEITAAQADLDSKQSALAEAGKALYTWQSTAGSVSVGDVSKGITRQITDVAAGTADTDAVNVAQLKANKVTVAAGNDNVTVTSTAADDGGTMYTVASKDTYTTKGTYDADSKKITFTQNDTEKNYEVDLSGITDNIDKGLSFAGDSGDAINKQLGETMDIVGGATDVTTGSNIGVVSADGKLNVRLAKDLTGLNSVKVGDAVTLGTTGLTITNGPSVTTTGINAGNQKITNVVAGVADTDAVNVSQLNANKIHYFQVNSAANGTNYNNNGATGTDAIAIGKATAMPHNSVVIGNNAQALDSNGGKGSGDIAIGNGAKINNYADQSASIAIGQNAQIDNMAGQQEALFSLGQTTFSGSIATSSRIPADPSKVATGIAIGENTFVRSGGLMIGTHNYRGALGDVDVDSANTRATGVNINATTLGTNSYNNGAFSTITGAYNIATGNYLGGRNTFDAGKNFGATIMGSLNSVESATASSRYSGIANSVVGTANRTFNANGSLIFGAGNEITNSVTTINAPTSAGDSAKALQDTLMSTIKSSASGGSTLAIGGGNKADYTLRTAIIGVNNTVTGTSSNVSQENYVTGYNNTGTNVDNVTIIGTNRTVSDAANSVVIGSADSVMTSSASDAVTIGRNANTTIDGGVALGSSSVASVDKGAVGYNPSVEELTDAEKASATWTSTLAAVSVGDSDNNLTRQITNVAAGTNDTDAVNVAQLKANKVTLTAGDNVTITPTTATDGSTDYKIASTDTNTYVTEGSLSADGTLTLTRNDKGAVIIKGLATKDDVANSETHYYSVNDRGNTVANYDNKGAKGGMSLAAGPAASAYGSASTVTGAFSRIEGNGENGMSVGFQGATASVYGSFNVVGAQSGTTFDGVANSIVGVANKTENANAALIMGAGNKITNSYRPVDMTTVGPLASGMQKAIDSGDTDDMITALSDMVKTSGGAVLAVGGANTADYALLSKVVGVGNTLTGTEGNESKLNMLDGYMNTGTNVNNVTIIGSGNTVTNTNKAIVLGDSRQLTSASNSVILGSADRTMATTVADATAIGHNANVTVANGVALGSGSVASVDAGVAGYDVETEKASTNTTATWKSTAAAVSVGDTANNITRQITGVAAGMEDTDAVNVAQLKKVAQAASDAGNTTLKFTGDDTTAEISRGNNDVLNITGGAASSNLTDGNIGVVKDGDTALKVKLSKDLTGLNSVAVGDVVTLGTTGLTITNGPSVTTTGIDAGSKTITNVANGVNPTDAVNVSQLNANKVTVVAGNDNVTVTPTTADDGATTYTVASKDTYTTSGTYDANSKKIKFVQNDTKKNYEVDLSALATSDEVASSATHYYSVNDRGSTVANYDNTGAKAGMSIAAGPAASAYGSASTVTGAFSRIEGNGENGMSVGFQGATASVYGSFNVVGAQSGTTFDGVANSIVGVANKTENANAALIMGAGNKITNSYRPVDMTTVGPLASGMQKAIDSGDTDDMITALSDMVKTSGGAVLAVGGANTADYALLSKVVGVGNTLTGTEGNESKLNMLDGYMNTGTNVNNVTIIGSGNTVTNTNKAIVLGDSRQLTSASNSVILGSADRTMATTVADATVIGHNANVTVANGVALGSGSVASVDAGVAGYDVETEKASTNTTATWKSTAAAVSVGDAANNVTRQITGVAAGMEDTDAVNVAQLKKVAQAASDAGNTTLKFTGDDKTAEISRGNNDVLNITGGAASSNLTDGNIGVVKDGDTALKVKLSKDLTGLNSVAVGDAVALGTTGLTITNGPSVTTTGIDAGSKTITNVANGVNPTDAVNVSQLNANKVTVVEGENVKLNTVKTDDGTTYTVNAIDTKVTGGTATYDKSTGAGTITLTTTDVANPVKVTGLQDTYVTDVDLEDHTLTITQNAGNPFVVNNIATLDDGLNFTGDTAGVTIAKKLNSTLSITGGITDETKLSDNNIGVVAKADGGLTVKLAKDLTMADGSISFNNGVKLSSTGLDNGNQKITNVAAGTADTDAVNVSQLNSAIKGAKHTEVTLNGNAPTAGADGALGSYIGTGNLTMAVKDVDGQKVYDLKMSNNLVAGTPGADGKNGEAGSVTIIGEPGSAGADGKNASANIIVKDGSNGLDGKDGFTRVVYTDEDGTPHEVATLDDGLNFTGDTADVTVSKKLNETLSITGGITDADQLTTVDNIGVVASDSGLKVRLAKNLNDLNSVRVGGSVEGQGIYIANQTGVKTTTNKTEDGLFITGLTNTTWNPTTDGIVSGRAATEDQLQSVYNTINSTVKANKVVEGKNITVTELANGAGTQVALKDDITLGDASGKNVAISGTNGTITAGDGGSNQVAIDGTNSTITAGTGDNKVTVDGNSGLVTVGDTTKGAISIGNQTVTPKVVGADGTETDGTAQTGKYITGLDNTTWDPTGEGYVADRAATEGQLKDIADQISNIDTAVKSSSRVFESDSGADAGSLVTVKNTDPMKLKGGATGELSDGNIGVVNNSDKTGFDIKLAKDIKDINTIQVNNSVKIGIGDKQTTIEGDTINTGSVTTGNTTINNGGLTIKNEDPTKNITIENNNISMGGNVVQNVGDGVNATDAINKGQFDRAISSIDNGMGQMNNRINKLDNRVDRVGAGAAALAALHPLEFSPEAKWEVSAGVGNYKGASDVALGAFYRPNGDTMFSVGTSLGGGENMINAGVTLRVGDGETQNYPSKKVMAQEITDLKAVVADQNERLASQDERIEELTRLVNTLISSR